MSAAPLAAATLATALLVGGHAAARAGDEPIPPLDSYTAADARALAGTHAGELQRLHADLLRCGPALEVRRHGIAFRRPLGTPVTAPYLTVWLWLGPTASPGGPDLAARAGEAFRLHGRALFRRLIGLSPIFAEAGVGGYGLILTWRSPTPREGRVIGESLAVFAEKLAVANFAHDSIAVSVFLERADVRAFDGQTQLIPLRLSVEDDGTPLDPASC